jgi:hypothetical protein
VDRDLDVFTFAVHEVFSAAVDFAVVNVDITEVVSCYRVSSERVFVDFDEVPVSVVFSERFAAGYIVVLFVSTDTLTTFYLMNVNESVVVFRKIIRIASRFTCESSSRSQSQANECA